MKIKVINKQIRKQIDLANVTTRPLYLIIIATKPCYIKLASLILAFERLNVPFLGIDVGQHYDEKLISAKTEFNYDHLISVYLNIRGSLLLRNTDLVNKLEYLYKLLINKGLRSLPIPVVSGDTSTAGMLPVLWYFRTGIRSIHVEAGLRSFSPFKDNYSIQTVEELISLQTSTSNWQLESDLPFPEGIDTRLGSIASQLYFSPVERNRVNLLNENYDGNAIHRVGSLSSDAVEMIKNMSDSYQSIFDVYPFLQYGRWLRVDFHRRENMSYDRLSYIMIALGELADAGFKIVLVNSNALQQAILHFNLQEKFDYITKHQGVHITPLWSSYQQVIEFILSKHCLGILTDSGGLQEEAQILGIPCITCRTATDRPETVLDAKANLLVPPQSSLLIKSTIEYLFDSKQGLDFFENNKVNLYETRVGESIAIVLQTYTSKKPAIDVDIFQ